MDTGGLTREFFHLIGYSIGSTYVDSAGAFIHNAVAYQVTGLCLRSLTFIANWQSFIACMTRSKVNFVWHK